MLFGPPTIGGRSGFHFEKVKQQSLPAASPRELGTPFLFYWSVQRCFPPRHSVVQPMKTRASEEASAA
jgi:hypothetical protein